MSSNLGGKAGLLGEIEQEWEQFLEAARGLSEEDLTRASAVGHWSARDVMVHTAAVNEELVKELTVFLAEGKEADYGDEDAVVRMNDVQLEEKQALSLSEVWELLDRSYREAFSYLQSLPEEAYAPDGYVRRHVAGETVEHYRDHRADLGQVRTGDASAP